MDRVKLIAKNSFWFLTARGIEVISNFIVVALIARYLGVKDFGIYSFAVAIAFVFFPFLSLGLPRILIREIVQDKKNAEDLISAGITLNSLIVIPIIIIAILFIPLFDLGKEYILFIFIIFSAFFLKALIITIGSIFVAFERMEYEILFVLFNSLCNLLFISFVIRLNLGIISIFLASGTADLLGLFLILLLSSRYFGITPGLGAKFSNLTFLLKESISLVVCQFLQQGHLYMGVFVLKSLGSDFDVGLFQAPYKLLVRLQVLPVAFVVALQPLLSQLTLPGASKDKLKEVFLTTFKLILIMSLPITILGFTLADKIIFFIFGKEFLNATTVMQILILGISFNFLGTIIAYLFISSKKQGNLIIVNSTGLLACLLLNLLLIPKYGYVGASIAVTVSNGILFIVSIYFLLDCFKNSIVSQIAKISYPPILVASIIGMLTYTFKAQNNMIIIVFGLILFFLLLFIFRVFSASDIRFMKKIIGIKETS